MRGICLSYWWLIIGTFTGIQCQDPDPNESAYSDRYQFDRYDDGNARNFTDAEALCERKGGHLAFLDKEGSQKAITSIIKYGGSQDYKSYRVGATDSIREGTWRWLDGKSVSTDLWDEDEPDAYGDCAFVRSHNTKLSDYLCQREYRFICQSDLFTNFTFNDHVYIIHRLESGRKDFEGAKRICEQKDSRLVEIHTAEVNSAIQEHIPLEYYVDQESSQFRYWTGGSDGQTEGVWLWNDKTSFTFTDWFGNAPNGRDSKNCLTILKDGWYDASCSTRLPFICEQVPANNTRVSDAEITVAPGLPNTVTCEADGFPAPYVIWQFNNTRVGEVPDLAVHQIKEPSKSTLFLENATLANEGRYFCFGINQLNREFFQAINSTEVTVFIRPVILSMTPHSCNSSLTIKFSNTRAPNIQHRITVKKGAENIYSEMTNKLVYTTKDLSSITLHTIEITPCPSGVCRQDDSAEEQKQTAGVPDKVRNVTVAKITGKECSVNWTSPMLIPEEYISGYKIIGEYTIAEMASVGVNTNSRQSSNSTGKSTSNIFSGLPNRKYRFGIQAHTCAGFGEVQWSNEYCITDKGAPDAVSKPSVSKGIDKNGRANLTLTIPNQDNGPVSCLFLIVRRNSSNSEGILYNLQDLTKANASLAESSDYIAVAVRVSGRTDLEEAMTLGDGGTTSCNVMSVSRNRRKRATLENDKVYMGRNNVLDPNQKYSLFTVSTTPVNEEILLKTSEILILKIKEDPDDPDSEPTVGVPVAVSAVTILILISLIIAFVLYRRRRNNAAEKTNHLIEMKKEHTEDHIRVEDTAIYENTVSKNMTKSSDTEIKMSDLEEVYKAMLRNGGHQFTEEFTKLTIQAQANINTKEIGSKPELKKMNRYKNIIPFDNSRVVIENTDTGYINACHIERVGHSHKFIATQGPLKTTIDDFWLMIVEQKCAVIVMLAKCVEAAKRKCEKYWPEPQSTESYGATTVTNSEEFKFCGFIRRKLDVETKLNEGDVKLTVYQYHFTNWPDHGVPPTTSHLTRMHHEAMMTCENTAPQSPIVVHCSAGAGRTGTFIGYDILKEEAKKRGSVDVYNCVIKMREQRVEMVQNCDQYVLVHKLVLESYWFEDTDYSAAEAAERFRDSQYRTNVIPKQFENLSRVKAMDTTVGNNKEKMTAYQRMRVCSMKSESFIDASYVECYDDSVKLIASAGPTESNVNEFWKTIFDNNISVIIFLSTDTQYWANEPRIETAYGDIRVTWDNEEDLNGTIKRLLTVVGPHKTHSVTQLQLSVDLTEKVGIKIVNEMQKALNESSTSIALVHCCDGLGLTGTFCGIANLIARLKVENRVDVFRTIKDLRDCRPGMVQTINQYLMCHDAVTEYLESFDIYSNFR